MARAIVCANYRSIIAASRFHRVWLEKIIIRRECDTEARNVVLNLGLERCNNYTAVPLHYYHYTSIRFFFSSLFFFSLPSPPIYCNIIRSIWVYRWRNVFFFFFHVSQYTLYWNGLCSRCNLFLEISIRKTSARKATDPLLLFINSSLVTNES